MLADKPVKRYAAQMFENAEIFVTTFVVQLYVSQLGQHIWQQFNSLLRLFARIMAAANSDEGL